MPAWETAHQDLVRRIAASGALQEVPAVWVRYGFFDMLGFGIRVVDYDVDVLRGRSKVLIFGFRRRAHRWGIVTEYCRCRLRDRR